MKNARTRRNVLQRNGANGVMKRLWDRKSGRDYRYRAPRGSRQLEALNAQYHDLFQKLAPVVASAADAAAPVPNKGDTAWVLVSTVLVIMMTIPGLALFYGGMVRKKNVLATLAQSFGATCIITVLWMVIGYSIAFTTNDSASLQKWIGSFKYIMLKPMTIETRDLFRRPLVPQELQDIDAVVFDPPRQGAEAQAHALAKSSVGTIVAVSCNPATFARDARILLDGGYRLAAVIPGVDYPRGMAFANRIHRSGRAMALLR